MFAETRAGTSARCGFTSWAISTVIGRCGSIHSGFGSAIQTCHKEAPGRAPRASGLPKYPPARPRQDAPQRPRTARINVRFAPKATEVAALAFPITNFMEDLPGLPGSICFDARELHHLAPLFGLFGDELAEVGSRAWKGGGAPLGKPRLHLGIGKGRVDLRIELVDDLGWRV